MRSLDRRKFMTGSLGAASLAMVSKGSVRGANERVVVGIMGLGGRGNRLAEHFAQRPDVEVAYLCDVDTRRFERARKTVAAAQRARPKLVQDFRRILDDAGVDALVNATPDHWHALGTILACQAGKDVFVEKPMAHSIWEGRKMVEAESKYGRVVQVGMQSRSAPYVHRAREYIRAGNLGDVHLVRVYNMMQHPKREPVPDGPVPDGLDWDLWCGPAARRPYNPGLYWLNHSEYSCGPIAGDLVHQLDLARYLIGDPPAPRAASHQGGIYSLKDGRDTPDTQMALYEYDGLTMTMQSTLWTPYMKKTPGAVRNADRFPDWPFSSTKVEVLGTDGYMYFGRHGGGWQAYDADGELVRSEYGRQGNREHQDDFVDCIRTRRKPVADAETGHQTAMLCHLANISYRVGNRRLVLDPETETFTGFPEADAHLKRTYRKPWVIPEKI